MREIEIELHEMYNAMSKKKIETVSRFNDPFESSRKQKLDGGALLSFAHLIYCRKLLQILPFLFFLLCSILNLFFLASSL